jgi:hypothetical protein
MPTHDILDYRNGRAKDSAFLSVGVFQGRAA